MTHRLAPALTLAFLLSMPAAALAGTGGGGGSGGAPSNGSGGAASNGTGGAADSSCNVAQQEQAGQTCQECAGSDMNACQGELGADYSFVCSTTVNGMAAQVWCNGPDRTSYQSAGCSLGAAEPSPARMAGGAGAALIALMVWAARRRR